MNQGQEQRINAKILIVDDTAISRKLLAEILRREKYEIYEATDGTSGLEMARLTSPDLILLDICMPDLDGHAVCRQLKTRPETQHTPVIFVTASAHHGDRVKALGGGGTDYITKPFAIPELKRCVAHHLQNQAVPAVREDVAAAFCCRKQPGGSPVREGWLTSGSLPYPYPAPMGL